MTSKLPKVFALTAVALFAFIALAQPAAATSVTGTIAVPTASVPSVGLLTRHVRCAYLAGGSASNGVLGWTTPLAASDSGKTFTLSATGANVAIVFYASLGSCDGHAATGGGPVTLGTFDFAAPSGSGVVPAGSAFAIIVITGGANAPFSFST